MIRNQLAKMVPAVEFFSYAAEREGEFRPQHCATTELNLLRSAIGDLDFNPEIFLLSEEIEGTAVTEPEGWAKK